MFLVFDTDKIWPRSSTRVREQVLFQMTAQSRVSCKMHLLIFIICLELIQKVEGQVARVIALRILNKEEGFLTINEDKSLRVILKRDTGQFWPSTVDYLPTVPSSLCFHEESST
jgi:hypothetical protein